MASIPSIKGCVVKTELWKEAFKLAKALDYANRSKKRFGSHYPSGGSHKSPQRPD